MKAILMAIMAFSSLADPEKPRGDASQSTAPCPALVDRICKVLQTIDAGLGLLRVGKAEAAVSYFDQALSISRDLRLSDIEALALVYRGATYYFLRNPQRGLESFTQAMTIAGQSGNPVMQSQILSIMMGAEKREKPALAIFYGKQSVILVQELRANIREMDKETQKRFLDSRSKIYHDLANLLIDQGRLAEAQQVLDLLKQQEYTDYVRGNPDRPLGSVALTPAEQQAEQEYRTITVELAAQGQRWNDLKENKSRSPEEEKEFQRLSDKLARASQGLNDYYNRLYKLFGQGSEANRQLADVKGEVGQLRQIVSGMPHTVALYTFVSQDRVSIIAITGPTAVARSSSIAEIDLNRKIAALQQALRDPRRDPRPAAQDLYKVLIAPVKGDLDQVQATTLIWSLDGALRYIPMAVLFDGRQYLVESYNNVTITPASISHLDQKPAFASLNAAAMGISRQYETNLPALPAVATELAQIVRQTQGTSVPGVFPGTILLNDAFTQKEMESQLARSPAVVHIASHFVFNPGDDTQSYLLLAGKDSGASGYHLTVANFRDNPNLTLAGTDVLTLSACETGVGGSTANGREIDGLGMTAQLKGAKSVIASLWEVNDASTGSLMADFYRRWAEGGGNLPKTEALRQAQLDLLRGNILPTQATARGFSVITSAPSSPVTYSHPYYWAPFVLMGNWR